jgi:hypothetical protein
LDSNQGLVGLLGSVEGCFELRGWQVSGVAVEALRVMPVDRACQAGHRVLFATAAEWVDRLALAHNAGRLHDELRRLGRYPLNVVDEVGYIPFEAEAANLFFQLVSARYERASVIVTSNKPFVAAAMIDRLVHHAEVVSAQRRQLPTQRPRPREGAQRRHNVTNDPTRGVKIACRTANRNTTPFARFVLLDYHHGAASRTIRLVGRGRRYEALGDPCRRV